MAENCSREDWMIFRITLNIPLYFRLCYKQKSQKVCQLTSYSFVFDLHQRNSISLASVGLRIAVPAGLPVTLTLRFYFGKKTDHSWVKTCSNTLCCNYKTHLCKCLSIDFIASITSRISHAFNKGFVYLCYVEKCFDLCFIQIEWHLQRCTYSTVLCDCWNLNRFSANDMMMCDFNTQTDRRITVVKRVTQTWTTDSELLFRLRILKSIW